MARRLAGLLIVALSTAFLVHFGRIGVCGGVMICEPRAWVYGLEVAALVTILAYGLWYTVKR